MSGSQLYEVKTDMNPDMLTGVALRVYRKWVQFALGRTHLGGHILKHPSGKYAASIQWRRTGTATIEIFSEAPIAEMMETGRPSYSMKKMLRKMKGKNAYRIIPLGGGREQTSMYTAAAMASLSKAESTAFRGAGKMWVTPSKYSPSGVKFRTMSNKPGSASWRIPRFKPYTPVKFLLQLMKQGKI